MSDRTWRVVPVVKQTGNGSWIHIAGISEDEGGRWFALLPEAPPFEPTEAMVEAVAREICLQTNLDDGYADNATLRASIDAGMWRNYEVPARSAVRALLTAMTGEG